MPLLWPGIIFPDIFALIGVTNAMAPSVDEIVGARKQQGTLRLNGKEIKDECRREAKKDR